MFGGSVNLHTPTPTRLWVRIFSSKSENGNMFIKKHGNWNLDLPRTVLGRGTTPTPNFWQSNSLLQDYFPVGIEWVNMFETLQIASQTWQGAAVTWSCYFGNGNFSSLALFGYNFAPLCSMVLCLMEHYAQLVLRIHLWFTSQTGRCDTICNTTSQTVAMDTISMLLSIVSCCYWQWSKKILG